MVSASACNRQCAPSNWLLGDLGHRLVKPMGSESLGVVKCFARAEQGQTGHWPCTLVRVHSAGQGSTLMATELAT
ncbi:hypothetical protein E2562_037996 [Oryza meyeriana var. granulata]|uniref:Uncharacterized protein n=1 Tax=Oryza meyeriana var. granulata TaxID=110450 RepID=A0A6G1C2U9_9ORYZ|nr:hypothetical protein E2562_037996 [Oryza meyeriana var. granulata]